MKTAGGQQSNGVYGVFDKPSNGYDIVNVPEYDSVPRDSGVFYDAMLRESDVVYDTVMDNRYQQPDSELEGFDPKAVNYNTAIRKGASSGVSMLPNASDVVYERFDEPQF